MSTRSKQQPGARVRPAAVAGSFYPGNERELSSLVDRLLIDAFRTGDPELPSPKALIVPHAGYVYSGPIAARGYQRWQHDHASIDRVVLLGPAHRSPVRSMAASSFDAWETPLGPVAIDAELQAKVLAGAAVVTDDRAHAGEHSLEVHLPFLQRVIGSQFSLLPLVVGHASAGAVADLLELVWGGDETRIVISTDLSHYHPYDEATVLDRATASAIVSRSAGLDPRQACGAFPVQGVLEAARRRDLAVELLDLRNSGDTAGPRDRVVGYGAFTVG